MEVNSKKEKLKSFLINETLILTLLSIVMGLLVGALIITLSGYNPLEAYRLMLEGIFSQPRYIAWTVIRATPLILTGLSVAFAFRTGLFNIGAEGQFIIGALTAALLGYFLELPAILHVPIVLCGSILAAATWGGIVGFLKSKFGIHEVIASIMLNWIALYFMNYIINQPGFKRPGTEASFDIHESARISIPWMREVLGPATKVNWGIVIALVITAVIYYLLFKTTIGYELRAVGYNKDAAEYGGINVNRSIMLSMAIAGALAGAAGAMHVMGVSFRVSVLAAMEGYGFNGIAVALIGNNNPFGVILSAFLFGGLTYGGSKMQTIGVPTEVINIVIGSIIFFVATYRIFRYVLVLFNRKKLQKEVQ
ncbi:nucleoside ABC transporter membrane protein [Geosporobacter subterraneus DSM 17957]|uniref:Nucleoside ABC transporter membrane protein n=1 Tax=Geosporobacter subterraneus DSM 17957 TaxID=1121919 RepID=A0A1M6G1T2_9FIRM|nr:ABC transporter permease [Geosporobacter subterraneus]SHJ03935.1 nucleoside ABC transporter membrane protein [Geosporobacter subterraneus DSM 17957]